MKYFVIILPILFITLFLTKDVDAYNAPVQRAQNVTQTLTTRVSFEGPTPCHDEIQIIDKELAHGEQINAYPKTICR